MWSCFESHQMLWPKTPALAVGGEWGLRRRALEDELVAKVQQIDRLRLEIRRSKEDAVKVKAAGHRIGWKACSLLHEMAKINLLQWYAGLKKAWNKQWLQLVAVCEVRIEMMNMMMPAAAKATASTAGSVATGDANSPPWSAASAAGIQTCGECGDRATAAYMSKGLCVGCCTRPAA